MDLRVQSRLRQQEVQARAPQVAARRKLQADGVLSKFNGVRPLEVLAPPARGELDRHGVLVTRFRSSVHKGNTTFYGGLHAREKAAAAVHDDYCTRMRMRAELNSAVGLSTLEFDDDPANKQLKTRFEGVSRNGDKQQWTVKLPFKGTTHYLGCHDSMMTACRVYDDRAVKMGLREPRAVQCCPALPPGGLPQLQLQLDAWVEEQHHKMSRKKDKYRAVLKLHI